MHSALLLVTVLLAADPDTAADPDIVVREITHKQPDFDSIADVLHVTHKSGTIEFSGDVARVARIEIERFKAGKKLPTEFQSIGALDDAGKRHRDRIRFALSFVDTDFLALGDSKKGHCRVVMKLNVGAVTAGQTQDVPKKECDFSKMTNGGTFGPKASTKDRIPLFWMIDGRTASLISGSTPEEVLKNNPNGDLAIVYVRLGE